MLDTHAFRILLAKMRHCCYLQAKVFEYLYTMAWVEWNKCVLFPLTVIDIYGRIIC